MCLFDKSLRNDLFELQKEIFKLEQENEAYKRELSKKVIMNLCDECLPEPVTGEDELLQETGGCDKCGKVCTEVIDLELIAYYRSMGLSNVFINKHLPRLRKYIRKSLSFNDINVILSEKTNFAEVITQVREK